MKPSQKHSDAIFYQIAADEISKGTVDEGLLAKAAVKAEGDKKKAEALYIEWRVELLIEQAVAEAKKQNESNLPFHEREDVITVIVLFLAFAFIVLLISFS